MTFSIHFHPGYEKDDEGVWTVWDDEVNFSPAYEGLDREDCEQWIVRASSPLPSGGFSSVAAEPLPVVSPAVCEPSGGAE